MFTMSIFQAIIKTTVALVFLGILALHLTASIFAQSITRPYNIPMGPQAHVFARSEPGNRLAQFADARFDGKWYKTDNWSILAYISNFTCKYVSLRYMDSVVAITAIENDIGRRIKEDDSVFYFRASRHVHNIPSVSDMYEGVTIDRFKPSFLDELEAPFYLIIPKNDFETFQSSRAFIEMETPSAQVMVLKFQTR